MPKVESNIEISAPPKKIWEFLENITLASKLNITITDRIENESLSLKVNHPDFNGYGYILKEKGDMTELSYWVDYKILKHEKIKKRSLTTILNGLKNFIEHLEDGGDPDEYIAK